MADQVDYNPIYTFNYTATQTPGAATSASFTLSFTPLVYYKLRKLDLQGSKFTIVGGLTSYTQLCKILFTPTAGSTPFVAPDGLAVGTPNAAQQEIMFSPASPGPKKVDILLSPNVTYAWTFVFFESFAVNDVINCAFRMEWSRTLFKV